jgi:hypothetical protein
VLWEVMVRVESRVDNNASQVALLYGYIGIMLC